MSWTRPLLLAKRRAVAIHLAISAVIFVPFAVLIVARWFPPPLFFTDGGWQGLRLMLAVDMVLGPSLTFLVFDPAKSRRALLIDLGAIGLAQALALGFGAWTVTRERIEALAFSDGAFHAVPSSDYAQQQIEPGSWQRLGDGPPYHVFVRAPVGEEATGVVAFQFTAGLQSFALQFLYEPLSTHRDALFAAALSDARLAAYGGDVAARYQRLLAAHDGHRLAALPLDGYYRVAILVFDERLQLVGTLYPPRQ